MRLFRLPIRAAVNMPPSIMKPAVPPVVCVNCGNPILPGERRHISRQPGLRGEYHWSCYVDRCKPVIERGARTLAASIADLGEKVVVSDDE